MVSWELLSLLGKKSVWYSFAKSKIEIKSGLQRERERAREREGRVGEI